MRSVWAALGIAAVGALVSACASEPGAPAGGDDTTGDDTTADDEIRVVAKCERDFGAPLRKKVELAKDELRRTDAAFAKRVLAALDDGSVKVFPFCQMAPQHFEHFRADTDLSAFGATPEEQWRRLRDGQTRGMRSVHAQLDGYMWDDHVYIATGGDLKMTVETLAHEAEHVFRKAHERNFKDQRVTCVEEHAAARAEVLVHKDDLSPEEDRALLDRTIDLYELDKIAPGTCGYRR